MPTSCDKLVEIPRSNWPKLLELYSVKKVELFGYNLLKTQINCTQQNLDLNVRIYSLNGDWEQDGTFILNNHDSLIPETLSDSNEKILRALNCLDKSWTSFFFGFAERLLPAFKDYYLNLGKSYDDFKLGGTFIYHATKEQVNQFQIELPIGVTLGPLKPEYAELIHKHWPHRALAPVQIVDRYLRYNLSIGAFSDDGQLIAWALQLPTGSIGLLQVLEEYRRKGLGSLIVRAQSKQLAANGFEVTAPVVFENAASCALFSSLGFRVINKAFYARSPDKEIKM